MIATLLVITSLWASLGFQSAPPTVSGVVRDESGGVVAGALVVVRAGGAGEPRGGAEPGTHERLFAVELGTRAVLHGHALGRDGEQHPVTVPSLGEFSRLDVDVEAIEGVLAV